MQETYPDTADILERKQRMEQEPRYKKIRKAVELPFGTQGLDANNDPIQRRTDGSGLWDTPLQTEPVSTLDLNYPIQILR